MRQTRVRIPQLLFSHDRGYHVQFRDANGKPCRHRFDVPKEENEDNETRAKNQWRLWVIRNIPDAAGRPEFADLADIAKATLAGLDVTATGASGQRNTMPALIQAFIESERARVRMDDAPYTEGSMKAKQFEAVRHALIQIGNWAKGHFGNRFLTVPFGELWTMGDYKGMMGYFTTQAQHSRPNRNRKGSGSRGEKRGFAPTYAKKLRISFWRLASFAEDYPVRYNNSADPQVLARVRVGEPVCQPFQPILAA